MYYLMNLTFNGSKYTVDKSSINTTLKLSIIIKNETVYIRLWISGTDRKTKYSPLTWNSCKLSGELKNENMKIREDQWEGKWASDGT